MQRLARLWSGIRALRRVRWIGNCRGTSAVEFAIIAPLLITLYAGAVEVGNALTIYRRTDQIAYTAADLVAQSKSVSKADLEDITAASSSILTPYSTAPLSIVLTSVVADSNGNTTVAWSYGMNAAAHTVGAAFTLPTGITAPGSSVIVAEVKYAYSPLLNIKTSATSSTSKNDGAFTMSRVFYSRPRQSLTVTYTN